MKLENILPMDIEKRSMEIITEELGNLILPAEEADIIKRVIHTTADFDYARNLRFSPTAVEEGLKVLKSGGRIITDTNMACIGINKKALKTLDCKADCYMADADVAQEAKSKKITRAAASMEKVAALNGPLIVAVGNAPTALIALDELIRAGKLKPNLIIAVPVGFVNVVAAKELIMKSGVPYIVALGRKGGSNVAAAICNALMYRLTRS